MRNLFLTLLLSLMARPLAAQGAPPQGGADQPYTMEYYYKVQWGHQQEFLQLFLKNHYPLLMKNVASGRVLSVKIEQPSNHMTEESRWDFRVTIRYRNSTLATTANPAEAELYQAALARPADVPAGRAAPLRNPAWSQACLGLLIRPGATTKKRT